MSNEIEYMVVRDSLVKGVIGDVFMYGSLLGMYWFNYHYLGNNGVLNVIFTVIAIMLITNLFSTKYRKVFYSYDDALAYLQSKSKPTDKLDIGDRG